MAEPGPGAAGRAESARRRARALAKLGALSLGLILGGWLLRTLGAAPGTEWVDRYVRDEGPWGDAAFILVAALGTAAGVPRQVAAFLGGYAFGTVQGTLLALAAQVLGCALAFFWARLVGRGFAERRLRGRFGHRLRPVRDALAASPFGATLALRLLPVGSNLALNLLAGMAGLRPWPFLAASAIGYLPQTVVFALLGKGVRVDGTWQIALAAALLVASVLIGLWLLRRHRVGRALEAAGGSGGGEG
jgi:uncharacterized membrane protein YdjX (TVP38/TMEM64 family)